MIVRPPTTRNPKEIQIWEERVSKQATQADVIEAMVATIPASSPDYGERLKGLELLISQISPVQNPDFDKKLKELEALVHNIHTGTRPEVSSALETLTTISSQVQALISMQSNIPYDNLIKRINELEIKIAMIPTQENLMPKIEAIQGELAMVTSQESLLPKIEAIRGELAMVVSQQNLRPEIEELKAQIAMLHSNLEREVPGYDIYS